MQDAVAVPARSIEVEPAVDRADDAVVQLADSQADERAVAAARADPAAFRTLYERHWPAVYRYLRARTLRDEDAADLAATTFERALLGLHGYRPHGNGFRAWLLRIARNAAIDAARRRRPMDSIDDPAAGFATDLETHLPGPEGLVLAAEERRHVRRLVSSLPEPQRDAIVLRYAAGLTAREIAAVIGKSEAATQKLLTRALACLKEAYRDQP